MIIGIWPCYWSFIIFQDCNLHDWCKWLPFHLLTRRAGNSQRTLVGRKQDWPRTRSRSKHFPHGQRTAQIKKKPWHLAVQGRTFHLWPMNSSKHNLWLWNLTRWIKYIILWIISSFQRCCLGGRHGSQRRWENEDVGREGFGGGATGYRRNVTKNKSMCSPCSLYWMRKQNQFGRM
jgi:hypothetical protein